MLVANPSTSGFATNLDDLPPIIEDADESFDDLVANEDAGALEGWRLEWRSDGYARFRWQLKDATGKPITYITQSGGVGYKRGSRYVGKRQRT